MSTSGPRESAVHAYLRNRYRDPTDPTELNHGRRELAELEQQRLEVLAEHRKFGKAYSLSEPLPKRWA